MRESIGKSRRGFTLLEMAVVALTMAVILVTTILLLKAGLGASSRSAAQGMVQEEARRSVERIARELKDSSEESTGWEVGVNPVPYTQYYDNDVSRISFSRCTGYDATHDLLQWGPVVVYEHQPAAGSEPGKLVRLENGARMTVCDHVSEFAVHYQPDDKVMIVSLTVQTPDLESPGHVVRASYSDRVKLRN
jgi:Tfp pilus assembly protein PilE